MTPPPIINNNNSIDDTEIPRKNTPDFIQSTSTSTSKGITSTSKGCAVKGGDCFALERPKIINSYKQFNDIIMQPYETLFKDQFKDNFVRTCNHMFKKVGFGVFVYILRGEIHTYQIFANTTEVKPGSKNLTKKNISNIQKKFLYIQTKILKKPKKKFLYTKKKWGFGNCMFNNLHNWWKNNLYIHVYFDMLATCVKHTEITTCFFINLYDYPVLYNKKCGQYILSASKCNNNSTQPNNYIPVLSGSSTNEHYDKCLVYVDAWEIVTQKKFGKTCSNKYFNILGEVNHNWRSKHNTLMFRGANSSCHPNHFVKNDRLKVLSILKEIRDSEDEGDSEGDSEGGSEGDSEEGNKIHIDAGLVNVTAKPIVYNGGTLDISDHNLILRKLNETTFKDMITMQEQSNNKYILDIDGYVTPWRLCFELNYNSCIILLLSKYYSWFYDKLKHMQNVYIIDVNSKTLEKDLSGALNKFEKNDALGEKIARGSTELYDEIMNINYMKKYMHSLLSSSDFDMLKPINYLKE